MAIIIDYLAKNSNEDFTIVAETIPALKKGALSDFKAIMYETNRWIESHYNATDRIYKFANNSRIEFSSFETVGAAQAAGKRKNLFINEARYIPFDVADALITRTTNNIWIDFNPTGEFWAHTEIISTRKDVDFLILKYSDNECVPETIVNELKIKIEKAKTSEYWKNWCRVYIDGEIGSLQGVVFDNWREGEFDNSLQSIYAQDYGFSSDPTTLIKIAVNKRTKQVYVKEYLYDNTGLGTDKIFEINKRICGSSLIVADSAEDRLISDLRKKGLNILPCQKGAGSINAGVTALLDYEIIVDPESYNIKKELRNYVYLNKGAKIFIDDYNHTIDPLRYGFQYLTSFNYSIPQISQLC
jgi:phage terminase large subunit